MCVCVCNRKSSELAKLNEFCKIIRERCVGMCACAHSGCDETRREKREEMGWILCCVVVLWMMILPWKIFWVELVRLVWTLEFQATVSPTGTSTGTTLAFVFAFLPFLFSFLCFSLSFLFFSFSKGRGFENNVGPVPR